GIVITAGLYLRAIGKVFLGEPNEKWATMSDLNTREVLTLAPLLILIVVVGIAPALVLDMIHKTTAALQF
ncbi:MAG: NADH-quinone oxidoreductase subunit M, partial [Gammaproteobacteria bacterium]|nr:NADH-quinone oxidoreductase subunit M [Gammaproteobacteria bacterium]